MSQPTPKDLQLWHQLCEQLVTYPNHCATSEMLGNEENPAWVLFGESPQAIRRRIWLREVHQIQIIAYQPGGEWKLCPNWQEKLSFLEQVYLKGVDPLSLPQPWIAEVNPPLPHLSTTPPPDRAAEGEKRLSEGVETAVMMVSTSPQEESPAVGENEGMVRDVSVLTRPLGELRLSLYLLGDVARQWQYLQMTPHWEHYVRQQCQAIAHSAKILRLQLHQWHQETEQNSDSGRI
ncbi:hypothetical protein K4A83_19490 [Spirulina subsalsa FACHB-351]|uniref:Uncharacterized protein n=1 Tax=Spirulina subsalsa FACHB-351 TaxID=234711 RepID=A0ABT3LBT4_9CYAN|nr:hypothetical protein [Spirulina subsalsa]MCW6038440.1 hypothetical protein [Spirulina subsalsa FACHB-351]